SLVQWQVGGVGILDLGALAAILTRADWSFEFVVARPTGTHIYVDRIEACELPRAIVNDAEVDGIVGTGLPGRQILGGAVSGGDDGFARLAQTMDGARLTSRAYVNLGCWPDDITAQIPQTTSATYAALNSSGPQSLDDGTGA